MVEHPESDRGTGLDRVRHVYEALGREDPMYAVLTRKGHERGAWDPAAFFREGETEIEGLLAYIDSLGYAIARDRALDFGCGVGRLTQALADHFAGVVGIDISGPMIEAARQYDRQGGRVTYLVNTADHLAVLDDAAFDLVYSNKTLQHIPPAFQQRYIREFVRVLRPAGLAIFQMRNGPRIRPGSLRERVYALRRTHLRRLWRRIRRRPPYEMHFLARSRVEELVAEAGGRVVDVVDLSRGRANRSLRYCVTR